VALSPAICAHRGGAAEAPENTLEAIAHARACGAAAVELDVRRAADGVWVVFHDADLARLAGRPERIDSLPASALVEVELRFAGARRARIPTLAAALAAAAGLEVVLDLKSEPGDGAGDAEALARALPMTAGLVFTSFDLEAVAAFARARPEVAAGAILDRPPRDERWLAHPLAHLEHGLLRAENAGLTRRARAAGLRLGAWTVDRPAEVEPLAALGVTTVITDRPRALARALAQATRSTGR
jgi:glycerophosphoryl diester phosphodiesterase